MLASYKSLCSSQQIKRLLEPLPSIITAQKIFYVLLIILGLMFLFAGWVPVVKGNGKIIAYDPSARRQIIEAPIEGRIKQLHILEGEEVKAGQVIATMENIDPNKVDRLKAKLKILQDKLSLLDDQRQRSKNHVVRINKLYLNGVQSKRDLELAEMDLIKIDSEINKLNLDLQDLNSELAIQNNQEIVSPMDGSIMKVFVVEQSSFLKKGEKIAKIIPKNNELAAELIVRGKDLALLRTGQLVRLVFEGWPAVQVTGWPQLAVGTFLGEIKTIDAGDDGHGNFRIIVTPTLAEKWPDHIIRMGSKAEGWVQLKRVPLWWEIWRLISGAPPIA